VNLKISAHAGRLQGLCGGHAGMLHGQCVNRWRKPRRRPRRRLHRGLGPTVGLAAAVELRTNPDRLANVVD